VLAALAGVALLASGALAAGSAEPHGCGSFHHQADAQAWFFEAGGSPQLDAGALDADSDGVACEELAGPYQGYATLGYSKIRKFFYGYATMPAASVGPAAFACLEGNTHFSDGPRLVSVYRVTPGPDRKVADSVGAEARAASGRLVWKADRKTLVPGRYYAEFEERVRTSAYGSNQCPAFSSRPVRLP
jgi:hypothetical protein